MAQIVMFRDNTRTVTITVTLNGVPVNLTGCTLWFTVKYKSSYPTDPDSAAIFQLSTTAGSIVVANPTTGIAVGTILPAMTSSLTADTNAVYDVKLLDTLGNITTIEIGTFFIGSDVTRAGG